MTREEKSFETDILTQQIREFTRSYNKSSNKLREDNVSSLLNAVRELEAAVTPTEEWSCRLAAGYQSSIAMCLFLDWKIPSMMSKTEEATMSLDQLAEKLNVSKGLVRMFDPSHAILSRVRPVLTLVIWFRVSDEGVCDAANASRAIPRSIPAE